MTLLLLVQINKVDVYLVENWIGKRPIFRIPNNLFNFCPKGHDKDIVGITTI